MLPNDLFVHLFGFFIAHSAAMHSKKSLNLIKNIYLVPLQNIMELSLMRDENTKMSRSMKLAGN